MGSTPLAEEVDEARLAAFEGLVIMIAKVTVTQKKTGASRSYPAGDDGTAWVIEFERDSSGRLSLRL
jgi:hypothetical protein